MAGATSPAADALARAVHDLNGPLTVIRGMCATLLRDEPARDRRRALTLIDSEAVRVATGLRGLARDDGGRAAGTGGCDVAGVAAAAVERLAPIGRDRGLTLALRGRRAPARVGAPAADVERILDNLIWNAFRHAADGGSVVVGLAVRTGSVSLRVRDDGPGVPRGDRERIFLPGDRGSAPRGAGRGLGLAIARELAERNDGDLTLDAVGSGACFRLVLPLALPADPRVA